MRKRRGQSATRPVQQKKPHGPGPYMRLWRSRGFVVVLIVIVVVITSSAIKEALRRVETQKEIAVLEQEVQSMQQRNTEIQDTIALLQTSSYHDKEARVKLGVQKEGERVIILPGQQPNSDMHLPQEEQQNVQNDSPNPVESNPQKWIHFFWDKYTNT